MIHSSVRHYDSKCYYISIKQMFAVSQNKSKVVRLSLIYPASLLKCSHKAGYELALFTGIFHLNYEYSCMNEEGILKTQLLAEMTCNINRSTCSINHIQHKILDNIKLLVFVVKSGCFSDLK